MIIFNPIFNQLVITPEIYEKLCREVQDAIPLAENSDSPIKVSKSMVEFLINSNLGEPVDSLHVRLTMSGSDKLFIVEEVDDSCLVYPETRSDSGNNLLS